MDSSVRSLLVAVLVLAVLVVVSLTDAFVRLGFAEVSAQSLSSALMPLLIIALFIEPVQEVIVTAFRLPKRLEIEHQISIEKKAIATAEKELARLDASASTDDAKQKREEPQRRKPGGRKERGEAHSMAFSIISNELFWNSLAVNSRLGQETAPRSLAERHFQDMCRSRHSQLTGSYATRG